MNLIDLFIKRRKKVERLTKALGKMRGRELRWETQEIAHFNQRANYLSENTRKLQQAYSDINEQKDKYKALEDKYTTLKAIVLAIDDERIKEAVKDD